MKYCILCITFILLLSSNYLYSNKDCEFDFGNINDGVLGLTFGSSVESVKKQLIKLGFKDLKISDEDDKGQITIEVNIKNPVDCYPKKINFMFFHGKFFGADISIHIANKYSDKDIEIEYVKSIYYQLSQSLMKKINKPYNNLFPEDMRKKVEDFMYFWNYTEGNVNRLIVISQIFPNTIQFQNFKFEGNLAKGFEQLMKTLMKMK